MILPRLLDEDLYFIGGNDRRLEQFENMFILPNGITYNSYLLMDEKTAVMDAVDQAIAEQYYDSIAAVLGDRPLNYLVCNHVEPDHCATINGILLRYPDCTLLVSKKGMELLTQFYRGFDYSKYDIVITEDGSTLNLGRHHLRFYAAPNVHWPEVTMCFDETNGYLFSADAFGSFGAAAGYLYADEVDYERDWLDENRRYYTNIVGRHGAPVQKILSKLGDLDIKRIFPLHGLCFRTKDDIEMILGKYQQWSTYTAEEKGVVLVYGSMYNNSQLLCDMLAQELADHDVGPIRVYDVSKTNVSYLIADCFRFSHAVFCCNNYNTELYPKMDSFLRELMMLNWDRHSYTLIGNMSWGGRGIKIADEILSKAKNLTKVGDELMIKSSFDTAQGDALHELAAVIADHVKG